MTYQHAWLHVCMTGYSNEYVSGTNMSQTLRPEQITFWLGTVIGICVLTVEGHSRLSKVLCDILLWLIVTHCFPENCEVQNHPTKSLSPAQSTGPLEYRRQTYHAKVMTCSYFSVKTTWFWLKSFRYNTFASQTTTDRQTTTDDNIMTVVELCNAIATFG